MSIDFLVNQLNNDSILIVLNYVPTQAMRHDIRKRLNVFAFYIIWFL